MTLVALDGTPLVMVGAAHRNGIPSLQALGSILMDAANEACIMIGQIFTEDGGSHTIDTTGSSSLGWRTGAVTFANAGTAVKVGLATVDTATGPPGRATNVADVITFSVSKSHTGGSGTITANAWQENVPDAGTMTIANGDLLAFCVQMTARGGVDLVNQTSTAVIGSDTLPFVTSFTGGAYADSTRIPNGVITFSDGKLGFFYGGHVASIGNTTQTWNSGSATVEYGNLLQMPVPAKIYGIIAGISLGGDTSLNLYSAPLGTPVAEKTATVDANVIGAAATGGYVVGLFASPYSSTANQPLAAIATPTTATSISMGYKTFNISAHQKAETLGANGYAINRASGAFAAQNSNKDRFAIGLLVGAFDAGGGSTGYPASRLQLGM